MAYASVGDVVIYCESGDKFRVKVLGVQEKPSEGTLGEEYRLKVLEVLANPGPLTKEGLEFAVWSAKRSSPQFGSWYFRH